MTDTGLGGFARFVMPLVTVVLLAGCAPSPHYDLIIRNGLVLDGSGSEAVEADVAIHDGRFVEIGDIHHSSKLWKTPKKPSKPYILG